MIDDFLCAVAVKLYVSGRTKKDKKEREHVFLFGRPQNSSLDKLYKAVIKTCNIKNTSKHMI